MIVLIYFINCGAKAGVQKIVYHNIIKQTSADNTYLRNTLIITNTKKTNTNIYFASKF